MEEIKKARDIVKRLKLTSYRKVGYGPKNDRKYKTSDEKKEKGEMTELERLE